VAEYLTKLMDFLDSLSWYHYLGLFVIFAFIFGKKKVIDFEAKLFAEDSNEISGELEIEKFENESLKAKLKLDSIKKIYDNKIEIIIHNQRVSAFIIAENGTRVEISYPTLPTGKSSQYRPDNARKWNRVELPLPDDLKVENNQRIEIKVDGKVFAHGILLKDWFNARNPTRYNLAIH